MRRSLFGSVSVAVLALAACDRAALQAAREGLPQLADATIPLAGDDSASGAEGLSQAPLLGETADLYLVTRAVTGVVNAGVAWALGTVRVITLLPPTSYDGQRFTWGPSTPRNLEAKNNWKLELTPGDDGGVAYALKAKRADEDDTRWRSIMAGTHARGAAVRTGKGSFVVDWEAARELDVPREHYGKATVTYGWDAAAGYSIDVDFTQVRDGNSGRRRDARYRFAQPLAGPGSFTFATEKDLVGGDGQAETLVVHSRWEASGRGRSDVRASGGTLAGPATLSECWSDAFKRTYVARSWEPARDEGLAADCAFADAAYPAE
jgi:hypothetical protein